MKPSHFKTMPSWLQTLADVRLQRFHRFSFANAARVETFYFFAAGWLMASPATLYAAPPGNALQFDGSSQYVDAGTSINLANQSFTVELWARRDVNNANQMMISQGPGSNNQALGLALWSNNTFLLSFYANDLFTSATYTDNNWHHWACVYDASVGVGTDRWIYRDGVLEASDDASGNFQGSENFYIGTNSYGGGYFPGRIDEVRVWNVARTQTQIQSNMHKTLVGNEANLVTYYNFDQTSGSTLTHLTSGGNDGTLVNGPTWETATWVYLLTGTVSAITDLTASVSGNVINDNTATITASGICYGTSTSPTTPCTTDGTGSVTFNSSLTGLTPNTLYYARAYATNSDGTFYDSNEVTFTTLKTQQTITFTLPTSATVGAAPLTLTATGGASGNPVTFASTTPSVCTVSGTTLTIVSAGTCTVTADQAGDANYLVASQVLQNLTITSLPPPPPPPAAVITPPPAEVIPPPVIPPPLPTYQLQLQITGDGQGQLISSQPTGLECASDTQPCLYTLTGATWVTFTATPSEGSQFGQWGGDAACPSDDGKVLIIADTTCQATFELQSYELTVGRLGQGHVTGPGLDCPPECTGTFLYGTEIQLEAKADREWIHTGWKGSCDQTGKLKVTHAQLCHAVFQEDPAVPNQLDGNGDGTPDAHQPNVISLPDKVGGNYVSFEVQPETCVISDVYTDLPENYGKPDKHKPLPQGLIYFELACPQAQISVYYHAVSVMRRNFIFQKFGPKVPGDLNTVGWFTLPNVTFEAVMVGGKSVVKATYSVTDGGLGDSTGVDGRIVDPGGIVVK